MCLSRFEAGTIFNICVVHIHLTYVKSGLNLPLGGLCLKPSKLFADTHLIYLALVYFQGELLEYK